MFLLKSTNIRVCTSSRHTRHRISSTAKFRVRSIDKVNATRQFDRLNETHNFRFSLSFHLKKKNIITISNPGSFRIDVETAISGGVSDPRNSTLIKMFNLINIGERAGSGIPSIFKIWEKQGWTKPTINEDFEPDRITLSLPIGGKINTPKKTGDKPTKTGDKPTKTDDKSKKTDDKKQAIISYLIKNGAGKTSDLANHLDLKQTRTKEILAEMLTDGIIVPEDQNKNRTYKLK